MYEDIVSRGKSHQMFVGLIWVSGRGGRDWWVVDVKMFSLLPRIYYTGASSHQSTACSPRLAHPPRRHCGRVSWAFWASWSSAPPRLDLAGQGKHFSVKEQKQQRMDRGGRSNGDANSYPNLTD